jgi:hypothetical protein
MPDLMVKAQFFSISMLVAYVIVSLESLLQIVDSLECIAETWHHTLE